MAVPRVGIFYSTTFRRGSQTTHLDQELPRINSLLLATAWRYKNCIHARAGDVENSGGKPPLEGR